ncbi:unnamed protein product [Medioppia subpectinata]|uniref:Uncharacterized protein n=1 Tax=Medioppia subpectinata TaxID=1979941 RepID=A0A7R9L0U0_9ACAR|nr:unnamed protein product [Medioppia subpectinata]CAG2113151.1 unnamed protein product [Medioppia subpectinata]
MKGDYSDNTSTFENNVPLNGNPKIYNIGAVLSSGDNIYEFTQNIEEINRKPGILPTNVSLYPLTVPVNSNPIRTAQSVYAVIASHPSNGDQSLSSVSFTCGFYNIPVIGITNRESTLSNKNLHAAFIRTV